MIGNGEMRDFYDRLYQKALNINPAYEIYDTLRVNRIRDLVQPTRGPVLIVGCGSRRDFEIFPPTQNVLAFDLAQSALKGHQSSTIKVFAADARHIPIADGEISLIICSEVLEHIEDVRVAVSELRRVLKPEGTLIISAPNWLSWFGLARYLGEKLTRRPFHSDDQPYDDWKTLTRLASEVSPEFRVDESRGVWYLPPLHYRNLGVPRIAMRLIFWFYAPLEFILSRLLPSWGHLLVLKCEPA